MVYNRVARGMLHDDRLVLAVLLCRIHLKGVSESVVIHVHTYCTCSLPVLYVNIHILYNYTQSGSFFAPTCSESDYTDEFEYFLRGRESLRLDASLPSMTGMTKEQVRDGYGVQC